MELSSVTGDDGRQSATRRSGTLPRLRWEVISYRRKARYLTCCKRQVRWSWSQTQPCQCCERPVLNRERILAPARRGDLFRKGKPREKPLVGKPNSGRARAKKREPQKSRARVDGHGHG